MRATAGERHDVIERRTQRIRIGQPPINRPGADATRPAVTLEHLPRREVALSFGANLPRSPQLVTLPLRVRVGHQPAPFERSRVMLRLAVLVAADALVVGALIGALSNPAPLAAASILVPAG